MTKALLHELGKSLSYGRLSLKAKVLWPMLLASSDDQGRGLAEADAIKWYVCPNVPEIEIGDVAPLFGEMEQQGMITVYGTERGLVYQIVRWWEYQDLQWARPSKYDAPEGWTDRIRYSNRGDYFADNWDTTGGFCSETKEKPAPKAQPPASPDPVLPSELPRKPPAVPTQPNSTQLNSTDNIPPSGENSPQTDEPIDWNTPEQVQPKPKDERIQEMRDAIGGDVLESTLKSHANAPPDEWQATADVFCACIHGLRLEDMTESDQRNWPRKLKTIAEGIGASSAQMATALRVLPEKGSGYAFKVPGSYSSPYAKAFEPDIKIVIAKLATGQIGSKAVTQKPIIVTVPEGPPKWMES